MAFLEGNAVTYYNLGTNNPLTLANWWTNRDGTGTQPTDFTSGDIFTIQSNMNNPSAGTTWTVSGVGSKVVIEDGITLNARHANNTISLEIQGSGKYRIRGNHSNLTLLTMSSSAIIELYSTTADPFWEQPLIRSSLTYPNLTVSCSGFSDNGDGDYYFNNNLTVTNDLTFTMGNTDIFEFANGAGSNNYTISVGGNFVVNSGTVRLNTTASKTVALSITGNLSISGGTFQGTSGNGSATISCVDFNLTSGTFRGTAGSSSATGIPTFSITGDFNIAGGSYNARSGSATAIPVFSLNGINKNIYSPTLANSFHTINLTGSYTLNNNFTVGGSLILNNSFTLNVGTNIATLNGGLVVNGTGGSFNAGSGTVILASSTMGGSLPGITVGTLTINSPGQTVALVGNVVVNTSLQLTTGTLAIGSNNLTINGTTSLGSGILTGGSSSNLIVATAGAGLITIPTVSLNNLSINRTAGTNLAGAVTVNGTLTLTDGQLDNGTNALILGNGANVVINRTSTAVGSLSAAPTFGTTVNVTYTGNTAITANTEIPSSSTVLNNFTNNNTGGITINSPMTVNGNLTNTSALAINQATTVNGVLTLSSGILTSGAGNLTMNLNSGYIANSGSGSISGNINCSKTAIRAGYHMLTSPVQGAPSFASTSFFKYYNEVGHDRSSTGDIGYTVVSPTSLSVGSTNIVRGYVANYPAGSTALNLTGSYVHGTDYIFDITKTLGPGDIDSQNGWNLIGNPFPSTLDWDGVYADNSSIVNAQCHYYNGTGYVSYAGGIPGAGGMGYLPPMQAIFIKKIALGLSSLLVKDSRRVNGTKNLNRVAKLENVLEVAIDNGTINDKTYIRLHPEATDVFDSKFDANKLNNTSSILPNINTLLNDFRYSINTINSDSLKGKMIPLKITVPATGSFDLKFREEAEIDNSVSIYLHDKLKNVVQDIRLNPVYNITAVKGDTAARFFISFDGVVAGVDNADMSSTISAHYDKGTVNTYFKNINANTAEVSFYNTMGMEIYNKKNVNIANGKYSFSPNIVQAGVYILKVSTADKTYTQRILINL